MRLRSIAVEEFRGWVEPQRVDLDASVVVIHGANGTGKTSLLDAVLWVLTGELARLGDMHKTDVRSLYGESGNTRARLELADSSGAQVAVTRSTDGEKSRLRVEAGDETWNEEAAEAELLRRLWPNAIGTGKSRGLGSTLARAVYLQQDDVRRFIEADDDAERFAAVAELVGAARYGDLQRTLESERLVWSRATNERRAEAAKSVARLNALRTQLSSLSPPSPPIVGWEEWRRDVVRLAPGVSLPESAADPRASEAIDNVVRQLDQRGRQTARRLERLQELSVEMRAVSVAVMPSHQDIRGAQSLASAASELVAQTRAELLKAEQEAAAERASLTRRRGEREELRSLATLALRHLGETCPVCQQSYDVDTTRARLLALAEVRGDAPEGTPAADKAAQLAEALAAAEAREAAARSALADLDAGTKQREAATARVAAGREELDLPPETTLEDLLRLIGEESNRQVALREALRRAETLALQIAQTSESSRRSELAAAVEANERASADHTKTIERRDATAALGARMIEALRAASDDLVSERVRELGPTLDRIYARIDPHPSFQVVELLTRTWRGRGRLDMRISDPISHVESQAPHVVLSSSQLNALALSVFLTLNLGVEQPLAAVLLDDPLQSLDEINLLGVADLLRRMKPRRQIIVATHDRKASELLVRKLRPVNTGESLTLVRLAGWERTGPLLRQASVPADSDPWRIAAQA